MLIYILKQSRPLCKVGMQNTIFILIRKMYFILKQHFKLNLKEID